jgi:hypothetical protein
MAHWRVPGWVLLLLLGSVGSAAAQGRPPPTVELRENYPNPFFPATTIPFVLATPRCEGGHRPLVSLKIYNVLAQHVAIPILLHSDGRRLDNVRLSCGLHEAYWDGSFRQKNRQLTPGIYYAQLTVDGERYTLKMIASR